MPSDELIKKATKITSPPDGPMHFNCYQCHHPHQSSRPDWSNCMNCHSNIMAVGKHGSHVQVMGLECKQCHKPQKKDCVMCHDYKEPESFLSL
jgi:hypothetical protein